MNTLFKSIPQIGWTSPRMLLLAAALSGLVACDGSQAEPSRSGQQSHTDRVLASPARVASLAAPDRHAAVVDPQLVEDQRFGLSVRTLMQRVAAVAESGAPMPAALEQLQGMGWIEGFVIDPEQQDLVLIGRHSRTRPSLRLGDLVTAVRNVWAVAAGREVAPYCSLDPRPEDIRRLNRLQAAFAGGDKAAILAHYRELRDAWGPQRTVIGGVPSDSRWASACIDADYHMKAVSQSHVSLPDVVGRFQSSIDAFHASLDGGPRAGSDAPASAGGMSRFWFHIADGEPRFRESDGIVLLDSCLVTLLTEAQVASADGELHDAVGQDDPDAQAFAADFAAHLARGSNEPRYQDLENLYRLLALVHAMHARGVEQALGPTWTLLYKALQPARYELPDSLPGLTNFREISVIREHGRTVETAYFFPLVMGGGSFAMEITEQSFLRGSEQPLRELRAAALRQRPTAKSLFWPIDTAVRQAGSNHRDAGSAGST